MNPNTPNEPKAAGCLSDRVAALEAQLAQLTPMAKQGATALSVVDDLLRGFAQNIAVHRALRRLINRVVATVEKRTEESVDAEYLRLEAEEYERTLLHFGDEHPELADFLDTRKPEERNP